MGKSCSGCLSGHLYHYYSLITSLCTLYNEGWCHSDLVFIAFLHFLMRTPSLTCLVRQSLFVCVTLASKLLFSPLWCSSMCFLMKDPSSCSPLLCSPILVYRFLEVSPMYFALIFSGHNLHSIQSYHSPLYGSSSSLIIFHHT